MLKTKEILMISIYLALFHFYYHSLSTLQPFIHPYQEEIRVKFYFVKNKKKDFFN